VIASKQPVDILFGSFANFLRCKDREMTGDMTELVKQYKFDLASVEKQYVDMVQQYHDGKLPLLPVYDLRLGVYYNIDLFDKFGVPYPKDGTTWENLLDTARKLTREESGVTYRGFATASAGAGLAINQYSLGYTDPKTGKLAMINGSVILHRLFRCLLFRAITLQKKLWKADSNCSRKGLPLW
jgi:multiple sugar transport system substrate-binding protein